MKLTSVSKFFLFLSSYALLFFIISIKIFFFTELEYKEYIVSAIIVLSILSILVTWYIVEKSSRNNPNMQYLKVDDVEDVSPEGLAYIVTYILPLAFSQYTLESAVTILFFLGVIYFLYCSLNMFYINPILSLLGYKILKIVDGKHNTIVLFTKKYENVYSGERISAKQIHNNLFRLVDVSGDSNEK